MDAKDPVLVAQFSYRHDAELALGFLQDVGIQAGLFVDDAGAAQVGLAYVNRAEILVAPEDADEARRVLRSAGIETVGDG
jgi:hypothetical protein